MAYVLSSVSGNLISAASAGFAPTNSADVSAIASAYQVVSATATQLYAGTAYVTSVNEAPLSAARAGNAANAVLATSAWYDGTGRLISSLPDEATVSSIASAYAESAASSKQDALTFGYDAENKISSIDGSAIAGDNEIVTSLETATSLYMSGTAIVTITSVSGINGFDLSAKKAEYANSADNWASAYTKLDASASSKFVQTANIETRYGYVTAIKGSGLMGCDTAVFIDSGSSFGFADANTPTALPDGTHTVTASKPIFTSPTIIVREVGQSTGKTVFPASMATTARITGISALNPPLEIVSTTDISFTAAYANYASAQLAHASALPTYQYDAEDKISSINGSAIAGGTAGVDSATCSAIASAYAESAASSKLDTTAFNSGDFYTTANESGFVDSAYVDSAVSSKADSSALSSYVPYSSLEYNTASAISGINGSALAAGSTYSAGEGIDITDDVISVETPVDVVAGPGIVIDNPDGNTLRVSQAANYEVTLFENASGTTTNIVCSEKMSNFDRVRFYLYPAENTIASEYTEEFAGSSTIFSLTKLKYSDYANIPFVVYGTYYSTTDSKTITFDSTEHIWFGPSWNVLGTGNTSPINVVKIVGVNRIAND